MGGGGGFGGGGFGHGGSSFMGGGQPGETIVNNYYDSPEGNSGDRADNLYASDDRDVDNTDNSADYREVSADDDTYDDSGSDDSGGGGDDLV